MMTLTRWIVRATLPLTLLLAACDADAPVDERAEAALGEADEAAPTPGKHGPPWERICALAGCSEAQVEEVAALFKANRPARGDRPDPAAFKELDAALAAKLRDGSLTAADLAAHRQAIHAGLGGKGPQDKMAAILLGLHRILNAEQRGALADALLAGHGGGLMRLGGAPHHDFGGWDHEGDDAGAQGKGHHPRGGKQGKHGERGGDGELKGIGKLCKIAECSDEQRATLRELAGRAREAGKAGREQARAARAAAAKALADAFRGDAFDQGAIDRFHAAMEPLHAARLQARDQLVIEALTVLDAAQRAKVAAKVEEKGMRALMPGKHGKRGKHGKHGKHGKRRGHGEGPHRGAEADDDVPA